jgi:hypothetical protein
MYLSKKYQKILDTYLGKDNFFNHAPEAEQGYYKTLAIYLWWEHQMYHRQKKPTLFVENSYYKALKRYDHAVTKHFK